MKPAGVALAAAAGLGLAWIASRAAEPAAREPFGVGLLRRATGELGLHDDGGRGTERIRQMLAMAGASYPAEWCAAALSAWIVEEAASRGEAPPLTPTASALALGAQMRQAARVAWLDAASARMAAELIVPGSLGVWTRAGGGHVAIVEGLDGAELVLVAGNGPGGAVARYRDPLSSAQLVGFGRVWSEGER